MKRSRYSDEQIAYALRPKSITVDHGTELEPSVLVDLWNAFGAVRLVRNSSE